MRRVVVWALISAAVGCSSSGGPDDDGDGGSAPAEPTGVDLLGMGTHDPTTVDFLEVATVADGLNRPMDIGFHPTRTTELWIVNQLDHSVVVIDNPGEPTRAFQKYVENAGSGQHFLAKPSGIAHGLNGNFATAHEEDQPTQGSFTPFDFMGPTMWTSDRTLFNGGDNGHLDMLHDSPLATGIAWQVDNTYWVFDGYHGALVRYDFRSDHGLGGEDHSDGAITRFVEGQVGRVPGVHTGMWFDAATNELYVNDPGHSRIARLHVTTGTPAGISSPNYDGCQMGSVAGATLDTFVDTVANGHAQPSGLVRYGDYWIVADAGNGNLAAYSLTGELVDWLPTGLPPGALQGLDLDVQGRLYYVDAIGNRVVRISIKEAAEQTGS